MVKLTLKLLVAQFWSLFHLREKWIFRETDPSSLWNRQQYEFYLYFEMNLHLFYLNLLSYLIIIFFSFSKSLVSPSTNFCISSIFLSSNNVWSNLTPSSILFEASLLSSLFIITFRSFTFSSSNTAIVDWQKKRKIVRISFARNTYQLYS